MQIRLKPTQDRMKSREICQLRNSFDRLNPIMTTDRDDGEHVDGTWHIAIMSRNST